MRFKIIIFFLFIVISTHVRSQNFKGGLIGGFSVTQVSGDEMGGYNKGGFLGGIFVSFPVKEKIDLEMEMLFSQKGSKVAKNSEGLIIDTGEWDRANFNYIEVPVLINFDISKKFEAHVGLSAAYLLSYKIEDFAYGVRDENRFKKYDVDLVYGVSYHVFDNLDVFVRHQNSIYTFGKQKSNFFWSSRNTGYINIVLTFGARYYFGKGYY